MSNSIKFITAAGVILFAATCVQATVVEIFCEDVYANPLAPDAWMFDYIAQELTFQEVLSEIGRDVHGESLIRVLGSMDSDSTTFTIIKHIANMTGVSWTEYIQELPPPVAGGGTIVFGSAESTKLQTTSYPGAATVRFTGTETVLDGGYFTIQFDVECARVNMDEPWFLLLAEGYAVPEPASVLFLAFGALALLRRRKT
ncbi:MAG: PEP-CTERM sorting domain-containing protein [Phycisphaerales bacterium]|nr:MAG: PEP-CTERM sorting domain-containing protein [Phycisphaerales bacterium]